MLRIANWFNRLRRTGYHHVLFWFFYSAFWVLTTFDDETSFSLVVQNVGVTILFHALVTYFNLYVLIPNFLQKKLYISYSLALMMSISLVCYPLLYILYRLNSEFASTSLVWNTRFFFVTATAASYTVIITSALKLFFDWFKKENEAQALSILNRETELKYLKNQINPHFLFNSLNNLYSLSLKQSKQTPEVILKLSEILRYLLYESASDKVPLDKELNYLRNYIEIERLRFGHRAEISLEFSGEFDRVQIEPMLLIPFVENAFKHGLGNSMEVGFINVVAQLTDEQFFFSVRNNVLGSKVVYSMSDGGIGNQNVEKRLELLYPGRYELNQTKSDEQYEVQLKLMLE